MATKKKVEEQVAEELTTEEIVTETSAAAATLQANSKPSAGPESRTEVLSKTIGALSALDTESLTKFFDAVQAQVGTEGQGVPEGTAAKNAASIVTHPSAAVKESTQEDVSNLLGSDETLSEEFKTKVSTLFEAAIEARIIIERELLVENMEKKYEDEYEVTVKELCEHLDSYLEYVATEWFKENEVAINTSLRNEIIEEFMEGLKNLFVENYIDIPEEQENVIETLTDKISELEEHVNTLITENSKLIDNVEIFARKEAIEETVKTLPLVQQTKFKELCENIEYDNIETFKNKLEIIKESHFATKITSTKEVEELNEDASLVKEESKIRPEMKRYVDAISRMVKK